jgi:hypothetical protein
MGTWGRVKPFSALWPAAGWITRPRWARPSLLIGSCGGIEADHGQKRDPSDGNHRERLDSQRAVTEVHRRVHMIHNAGALVWLKPTNAGVQRHGRVNLLSAPVH